MDLFFFNDTATTEIYTLSLHDVFRSTVDADPEVTRTEEGALIELFKKQRPGEPPSVDNAKALLNQLFFDPDRKSTRLNSSHANISYAVFCLKKNIGTSSVFTLFCPSH